MSAEVGNRYSVVDENVKWHGDFAKQFVSSSKIQTQNHSMPC
jgi:hypothetical protein